MKECCHTHGLLITSMVHIRLSHRDRLWYDCNRLLVERKKEGERFYFPSRTEAMGIFTNTDWYCDESSSASVKEK